MPIQINNLPIVLTATPTTYTLPVTDPYDLYTITSSGTVTLGGGTSIVSSGTLVEGIKYVFKYTASITNPASFTIMGEALPSALKNKECTIEAYYNGSAWVVTFLPDTSQVAFLDANSLIGGSRLSLDNLWGTYASTNTAGAQILATLEIPADTFGSRDGDGFRVIAWGTCDNNAAELKTIALESVTGATTITLFENENIEDIVGRWQIVTEVFFDDVATGKIASIGTMSTNVGATESTDTYYANVLPTRYDYTVTQYINLMGTEQTPTGGQITVRGMRVEAFYKL